MDRVVWRLECTWSARPGRWRHKWLPALLSAISGEIAAIPPHHKPEPSARRPGGGNEQGSWRRCGPLPGTHREPAPRARRTTRRCAHRCRRHFPAASGQLRGPRTTLQARRSQRDFVLFSPEMPLPRRRTLSVFDKRGGRDEISGKRNCASAGMVGGAWIHPRTGSDSLLLTLRDSFGRISAPVAAIQRPVLDRLGDMRHGDRRLGVEIGDRPGNLEDAVVGAGRQSLLLHRPFEQPLGFGR